MFKGIFNMLNNNVLSESVIRRALYEAVDKMITEDRNELDDGTVEIDNFQNVRDIMKFNNNGDTLYFVELIKRKKDNPAMMSSREFVKQFYFKSADDFNNAETTIKTLCQQLNARAYIYMNARSAAMVDKYTKIYADRFRRNKRLAAHFGNNPMAFAAGRSFDAPDRPLCFVDIDSDDFNDISAAMKIIQDAGIKPLFAYRSMNNGLHVILPNKDDAKKLDFSSINGDLSGLSQFAKNNAKVSVEIDKPTLLYASLKPNGYGKQAARLQKFINQRDQNRQQGGNNNRGRRYNNNGQRRHP